MPLSRTAILLSDLLRGLLPRDGPVIVKPGACFGRSGGVYLPLPSNICHFWIRYSGFQPTDMSSIEVRLNLRDVRHGFC
jgi:hypothetical protein